MKSKTPETLTIAKKLIGISLLLSGLLFLYQLFGNEFRFLLGLHKSELTQGFSLWITVSNIVFFILMALSYFNLESGVNPRALSIYLLFGFYLIIPLVAIYFVNRTESKAFYRNVIKNY